MPERRWAAILSSCKRTRSPRPLSERQRDFIETRTLSNGITVNNSFRSLDRVVQTSAKVGTNPYGKPAMEFTYAGGVEGIAVRWRICSRRIWSGISTGSCTKAMP